MKKLSCEEVVLIGTSIAIDLCKDKNICELQLIRNICNQVCATISTIISEKYRCDKKDKT